MFSNGFMILFMKCVCVCSHFQLFEGNGCVFCHQISFIACVDDWFALFVCCGHWSREGAFLLDPSFGVQVFCDFYSLISVGVYPRFGIFVYIYYLCVFGFQLLYFFQLWEIVVAEQ